MDGKPTKLYCRTRFSFIVVVIIITIIIIIFGLHHVSHHGLQGGLL